MEVFALIGPTGTGKSHRAQALAHEYNIKVIIDDGLIIEGARIVAGSSAKKEPSVVGAIRTALFENPESARQAQEAIARINPSRILVLATSKRMAEVICQRLRLPMPSQVIRIEEVATNEQIQRAKLARIKYGRHVVPAPIVEVRPRLAGTIIEPMLALFRRPQSTAAASSGLWVDQTVVRPAFSYFGHFYVSVTAINDMVRYSARGIPGVQEVLHIESTQQSDRINIVTEITADLSQPLPVTSAHLQRAIKKNVEHMTALNVSRVDIIVKRLHLS
ncbi:MAG: Asp23/Gls24 family envelope stress response protein [Clostridia bacterium]|nr:Asp23/Gls24 family envelope stress response protein [Clostridia bacterium]